MSKYRNIIGVGLAFAIASIILWRFYEKGYVPSDWNLVTNEFIALFGWLLVTAMSLIYLLSQSLNMVRSILFSVMIGVGFSSIIGYMYDNGIYFDTIIIGDNNLWEIQLILIVMWFFIGILKGVRSNE